MENYNNRIKHLEEMHRVLDNQITDMEEHNPFNRMQIEEMKKQKLKYKDEIVRLTRLQWMKDHADVHFLADK